MATTDTEELNRILLKLEKIDQESTAQLSELNTEVKLIRQEMTALNERSKENNKILNAPEKGLANQFAVFLKDFEILNKQFDEHIAHHKEKEKKWWEILRPIAVSAIIAIGSFLLSIFVLYQIISPQIHEIINHVTP